MNGDIEVWAAYGCHPHFVDKLNNTHLESLQACLKLHKTVALGELGLDYSYKYVKVYNIRYPNTSALQLDIYLFYGYSLSKE